MGSETQSKQISTDVTTRIAFGRTLDWAIGAILSIVGILVALGGTAFYYAVTPRVVAESIQNSEFNSEALTESEAIDALVALGQWSGVGLVVAGGLLVVVGIAVVLTHGRARHADRPTPSWILGVVGALVGSILSFIPFAPFFGGVTAGYLDPNRAASGLGTGTLAGIFTTLPWLIVTVFAGVGLFVGLPGEMATAVITVVGVTEFLIMPYFIGLSALGGHAGGWLHTRYR